VESIPGVAGDRARLQEVGGRLAHASERRVWRSSTYSPRKTSQ